MMTFSPWMHSISCILSKLGRNWSLYMLFAMDGLMKIKPLNFFFLTFFERNFVLMGLLLSRQSVDWGPIYPLSFHLLERSLLFPCRPKSYWMYNTVWMLRYPCPECIPPPPGILKHSFWSLSLQADVVTTWNPVGSSVTCFLKSLSCSCHQLFIRGGQPPLLDLQQAGPKDTYDFCASVFPCFPMEDSLTPPCGPSSHLD